MRVVVRQGFYCTGTRGWPTDELSRQFQKSVLMIAKMIMNTTLEEADNFMDEL